MRLSFQLYHLTLWSQKIDLESFPRQEVQGKKVRKGGVYAVINDNLEHFFNEAIPTQVDSSITLSW